MKNNINKLIIDTIKPDQLENLKELQAIYDPRNSFYKKAYIGEFIFGNNQKSLYLKSYNTIVACIYKDTLRIYGGFSPTTARHIREFAKQNNFFEKISYNDMKNKIIIKK